jgi:hypothetical protein
MVETPVADMMQDRPKAIDGPVRPAVGRSIERFAEENPEQFKQIRGKLFEKGGELVIHGLEERRD